MGRRKQLAKRQSPRVASPPRPVASRPSFPPEYGVPTASKGLLPWSHVTDRLSNAEHYWICTVSAEGRPHATPVDGLWLDDCLYFGGSPSTRWRRNLSTNAGICVHLESAMEVVMLQGDARVEPVDDGLARRLADASKKKYGYAPSPQEYEKNGALAFRPRVAFAWTNLAKDPTRWEF
jgi:nitroimidazol reductase NimA-like FMN-containing flavoprotein (pyridoxamine 5'-phosphate oxidase superfamily)